MFATPRVPPSRNSNVKVFVRTRPLLSTEHEEHAINIVYASSADKQVVIEDGSEKSFNYDGVLEEDTKQEEVYMQTVAPLVAKVKEGSNATVITYGQTGSGKTYTMGTSPYISGGDEGILQRALQELLNDDENDPPPIEDVLKPCSTSYKLKLSMVEIYSETVHDLLASKNKLDIKNEINGGASIVGLVEEHIDSLEKGLSLLERGAMLRSIGTTAMNNGSSRSHALIFLTVKNGNREGCLKLVDLAGAESVGRAHTSGLQFTEGVNINKGLLCLGKVLAALSNSSAYVPFRESLLTRVLKDSLGGGSYTTMIACVNPTFNNVHETINTLRYAEQARNIKVKLQVLSTIKKREAKRRLDDVSANSGAWKKRVLSSGKADHNSTISTPGHRPPVRKLAPLLNNTMATPSGRISGLGLQGQKSSFEIGKSLFPPPPPPSYPGTLPSLTKNIFEDVSPSGLSTISDIEETKRSPNVDSPFMERITSRLETTMMAQLENIEDRVADTIIAKLTQNNKGKRTRKAKKITGKSLCSTPDDDSNLSTDGESSCDNILEKTIAQAFMKKTEMKNVFEEAVSNVLGRFAVLTSDVSSRNVVGETELKPLASNFPKDPLKDVINVTHSRETCHMKKCPDEKPLPTSFLQTPAQISQEYKQKDLPITSTAFCETRNARRSTRIATKRSLSKAMFNELSPEIRSRSDVTASVNESSYPLFIGDVTDTEANTTVVEVNNSTVLESFFMRTKCESGETLLEQTFNTDKGEKNSKPEKLYRRRSTRLEALKATQRNHVILQNQSPYSNTTKKRRSCSTKNVSTLNIQKANDITDTAVPDDIHTMMASPRLQQEHNDSILHILNTGSLKKLQQLPTVGPKTAMVISNFLKLYGKLNSIDQLERVPGLHKNFYSRFIKANLVTGVPQQL